MLAKALAISIAQVTVELIISLVFKKKSSAVTIAIIAIILIAIALMASPKNNLKLPEKV